MAQDFAARATPVLPAGIFRCPSCHAPLDRFAPCACGFVPEEAGGVPLLVADRGAIARAIAAAGEAGRGAWYEASQEVQLEGAWRHHVMKRRAYLDRILAANGRATRGLDLGCGDGVHLPWLKPHVDELYASDYNLARLPRARGRGVATVFMADATNYPARDGVFDLILFNHVLEHIPDDGAALAEARRILKKGGTLVLGVPNEGAFFWRLAYRLQPETRRTTDHVHFYTADSLAAKCRAAGFTVASVAHLGWGVPHWGLDERLRRHKAIDDFCEFIGRRAFPRQATSLYLTLTA